MEAVTDIFATLFGTIWDYWKIVSNTLLPFKIPIFVVGLLTVLFFRFLWANAIKFRRREILDWISFGVLAFVQILTLFIEIPEIWLTTQIVIIIIGIIYYKIFDKKRNVIDIIYKSGIIFEDSSNRYETDKDNDKENKKRKRNAAIHRRYTRSKAHLISGIPVLTQRYIFKYDQTKPPEQLSRATATLNKSFNLYDWLQIKRKNGLQLEISASTKVNKIQAINFNKELSDQLDWYMVPLGAIDLSTKQTIKETPYVWMMHDPKTEKKVYPLLSKATLPASPAPQCYTVGSTGGGKSVLINTMIAHWVNKAKQNGQVELYLCDAKRVEFKPYESLKEVKQVAVTLEDAVDLTTDFCKEMHVRNSMLEKEGIKNIPLDGRVTLRKHIDINGHLIMGDEVIEYKLEDGTIKKEYAYNLKDIQGIVEVNIPEEEEPEEEEDNSGGFSW